MFKLETNRKDDNQPKFPLLKTVLGFFITSLLVLCSLYTCSWLSILSYSSIPLVDTRSDIRVDYGPWEIAKVHQVDFSIIKEVEEDRDDGVDLETLTLYENKGWFWWTSETTEDLIESTKIPTVIIKPTNTPLPTAEATQTQATPTISITPTTSGTPATPTETTQTITPTLIPTQSATPTQTHTLVVSATPTLSTSPTPTITPTPPSGVIIYSLPLELNVGGDWIAPELALGEHDNLCASSDFTETGAKIHTWKIAGFSIPSGATISGLEVLVHYAMKVDKLEINLSPDNINWGSPKTLSVRHAVPKCNNAADEIQGSATDLWGGSWNPANINDDVYIKLTASKDEEGKEILVDYIKVTIYFIP